MYGLPFPVFIEFGMNLSFKKACETINPFLNKNYVGMIANTETRIELLPLSQKKIHYSLRNSGFF